MTSALEYSAANDVDRQERELDQAQAFVRPRVELAEKIYSQAISSLWLGNSGAALATLSFIGVAWKDGRFPAALLLPLGFFILGVVSMGAGTFVVLMRERRVIERNQNAQSALDIIVGDAQSPLERVGLARNDWRLRLALCSAGCFLAGCVAGFVLLVANTSDPKVPATKAAIAVDQTQSTQ